MHYWHCAFKPCTQNPRIFPGRTPLTMLYARGANASFCYGSWFLYLASVQNIYVFLAALRCCCAGGSVFCVSWSGYFMFCLPEMNTLRSHPHSLWFCIKGPCFVISPPLLNLVWPRDMVHSVPLDLPTSIHLWNLGYYQIYSQSTEILKWRWILRVRIDTHLYCVTLFFITAVF